MGRLPRICPVDVSQHIIQRDNNRQICLGVQQYLLPILVSLKNCPYNLVSTSMFGCR
jgi:hypothetical protein